MSEMWLPFDNIMSPLPSPHPPQKKFNFSENVNFRALVLHLKHMNHTQKYQFSRGISLGRGGRGACDLHFLQGRVINVIIPLTEILLHEYLVGLQNVRRHSWNNSSAWQTRGWFHWHLEIIANADIRVNLGINICNGFGQHYRNQCCTTKLGLLQWLLAMVLAVDAKELDSLEEFYQ